MADLDAAFVQKDHSTFEAKPNMHHRQTDQLRTAFEVAKWDAFYHPP
ncbi:hypothetical protein [Roseicyclus sp.]